MNTIGLFIYFWESIRATPPPTMSIVMWTKILPILSVIAAVLTEETAPGIDRSTSKGVQSVDYNVVYGDEDLTVINEVVSDVEKAEMLKSKINFNETLPPLPPHDVKCLMSADKFCSEEMREMKNILIQAIKEDCKNCSMEKKLAAGKVVASLMAHDPVAWKMFLTRSALQIVPKKKKSKHKHLKYRIVGKPEEVESSEHRFVAPGVKIRVKRFVAEILP